MDFSREAMVNALLGMPSFISNPTKVWQNNEKELNRYIGTGVKGADNYYHRKAMCENAQKGYIDAMVSLLLATGKEVVDFKDKDKSISESGSLSAYDAGRDSVKDMRNNLEGMFLGLQNPEIDCKILLKDLDWESNTWKKQNK